MSRTLSRGLARLGASSVGASTGDESTVDVPAGDGRVPAGRASFVEGVEGEPASAKGLESLGVWHEHYDARVAALRARIEALGRRASEPVGSRPSPAVLDFEVSAAASSREPAVWEECEQLRGSSASTAEGPLHIARQCFDPSYRHGRRELATCLDADCKALSRLASEPEVAGLDLRQALFFDTETTGLSGGAGTLPFLVGVGFFEGASFVVEQCVLRQPGEEVPILEYLRSRLQRASCVVSYNGKSFDWPLLRTRFVMNRRPVPRLPLHIDLLHCARRVFRRRLSETKLSTLEREVLDFARVGDVGGSKIPELYLCVLRGAPAGILNPVLEHNAYDLVSLAALVADLTARYSGEALACDALDALALAEWSLKSRDHTSAERFARAALAGALGADERYLSLHVLGRCSKQRRKIADAVKAFEDALEWADDDRRRSATHLELAKLHEHQTKDLEQALEHARLTGPAEERAMVERRVQRLKARMQRENLRRAVHSSVLSSMPS